MAAGRARLVGAEHPVDDAFLDGDLRCLVSRVGNRQPRWTAARSASVSLPARSGAARILAAATSRMRRVADAQEPWTPPFLQTVDRACQKLDVVPRAHLIDAVALEGRQPDEVVAKGGEPLLPHGGKTVLADHKSALPVIAAVEHHQHAPVN